MEFSRSHAIINTHYRNKRYMMYDHHSKYIQNPKAHPDVVVFASIPINDTKYTEHLINKGFPIISFAVIRAVKLGHLPMVQLLHKYGAKIDELSVKMAVKHRHLKILIFLIRIGVPIPDELLCSAHETPDTRFVEEARGLAIFYEHISPCDINNDRNETQLAVIPECTSECTSEPASKPVQ